MYTRKQYMNKECSHREYYAQFVTNGSRNVVARTFGIMQLMNTTDQEHFNTIPLQRWDDIQWSIKCCTSHKLLAETGEGWSLCTAVCIAKEAAKQLVQNHTQNINKN